jgi:hypothetical protein
MKAFFFIFLATLSLSAIAEVSPIQALIEAEAAKDVAGQKSCFNGAIKSKLAEMEENYGGRFGGNYEVNTLTVSETVYRYSTKYCSDRLDKDLNVLSNEEENEDLYVYKRCANDDLNKSVAAITFGASTSGTLEQEGLVFGIDLVTTNDYIVVKDASYNADEDEIKSYKKTETLTCKLIEL